MDNLSCFERAKTVIPGGVNSPVRAFKSVGGTPRFIASAQGAYLTDVSGKRYIDYIGSWGPMILGHGHPTVIKALEQQLHTGISFGAPTSLETELAELIIQLMPSMEKIRFVSSGTEACMSAIRLARGYTGRNTIIKFEGCYHGHTDSLLVKAGSGALTLGVPSSPGVPAELTQYTLNLNYNDLAELQTVFSARGHEIAAVIIEPIAGNMNLVRPSHEYMQALRQLCSQYGSVLIIDEVMTGFRVALGGAQSLYGIDADITCLGKIIGGGMPVGAFGGKRAIMDHLAPQGPVYQAGTLSGNPLAMTAGLTTLKLIQAPGFYDALGQTTQALMQGLQSLAERSKVPLLTDSVGGMFGIYFTELTAITGFKEVMRCDIQRFNAFFHHMLEHGVYLAPSAFEAGFISSAHTAEDIEYTLKQAEKFFATL